MAAISNMRLKWPNPPDVFAGRASPLDALPARPPSSTPTARCSPPIADWAAAHPNADPGSDALDWCADDLRAGFLDGIRRVIEADAPRSAHDYGPDELPPPHHRFGVRPPAPS